MTTASVTRAGNVGALDTNGRDARARSDFAPPRRRRDDAALRAELERLRKAHLQRARRVLDGPQGVRPMIDGRRVLSFCSNDYLGLAAHPVLVEALRDGAARYGVGSGAAHLVTGHSDAHRQLEEALAAFVGRPRALLFSTGYMANLGVISALCGRGEPVYADRLNHASLNDGALLAGLRLHRYPHLDISALERQRRGREAALLITDGVFSMDGDMAPVPDLARIAADAGARVLVDDAHGLGVVGRGGRGTLDVCREQGWDDDGSVILVGTLGKAFGAFGAFVAASDAVIETLIQRARPYIYTTALPPAVAHATAVALALAEREDWRRDRLRQLIAQFRAGAAALELPLMASPTPIQPIVAGDAETALAWSRFLEAHGVLVTAIRPPTVPKGASRLRITLSAAHTEADVDRLLALLAQLSNKTGHRAGSGGRGAADESACG